MRVWKLHKGIVAYLNVVISVVCLHGSLAWASSSLVKGGIDPKIASSPDVVLAQAQPTKDLPPMNSRGASAQLQPLPLMPPAPTVPSTAPQNPSILPPSPSMQNNPALPQMMQPLPPSVLPPKNGVGIDDFAPMEGESGLPPSVTRRPPPSGMLPPPQASRHRDGTMPIHGRPRSNTRTAPNDDDIHKVVPQSCVPAKGRFVWNFEDEEVINILRQVSDLMCRTIVVNDSIGKNLKMTIIGKTMLTPKDAWDVLMASLASKGLALIEQGETWTVVKRSETKTFATPLFFNGKEVKSNEAIGTLFYKVQHASLDVLKNISRQLISKDGLVDAVGDGYLIVIDSNSNIRRLSSIFAQVDIEDAINKIHPIPLVNSEAKTVEKYLRELFDVPVGSVRGSRRRGGGSPEPRQAIEIEKIIADERTNMLIIVSDKEAIEKLKEVIALVDQPATDQGNKGKIHVTKLSHGESKKIADTLNNVVGQGRSGRFGGGRRRPDDGTHELFEGEVKITAHESTNTLVTVATPNDFRSLLATIKKLDVRKEQVYVEAAILDIAVNDGNDFGINLFGGLDPNWLGGSIGLVANPGGQKIADGVKTALTAGATAANVAGLGNHSIGALAVLGNFLNGGIAGISGKPIGDTQIPSFGAVLQALSTNSQVDVLSTPYLLTTDNIEAEMSVGEKIPVLKGASSIGGAGGIGAALGMPSQTVAYEDVKLTFKIVPHVGADDNVTLEVSQEVNEIGGEEEIFKQKQYRISTKTAKTTLVLKDQQTGVIGGLINQKTKISDTKVPFLGDIPILGWLFKTRRTTNERKNLLLIITPYIIRTPEDYRKIVERKIKEREEFAQMYYGGKIKTYNKLIDYSKKAGPISSMLLSVENELMKVENGGPGDGTETIITPQEVQPTETEGSTSMSLENSVSLERPSLVEEDFVLDEFMPSPTTTMPEMSTNLPAANAPLR